MERVSKLSSAYWWWFDSQSSNTTPTKSPWLHSTLADLDEKTEAMLKLIEEDADSFAKRAEMYYKKRPELISIVEDLYRAHRSLAEKYDQVRFEGGYRHLTPWTSCPLPLSKLVKESEKISYDSYSDSVDFDHDCYNDSCESVVIDVLENEMQTDEETEKAVVFYEEAEKVTIVDEELVNLREEIEKLREENNIQKEQLMKKDEKKREVIRQLSFSFDFLKQENLILKTRIDKDSCKHNSSSSRIPSEFNKLKGVFWGLLFNGESTTAVPL